VSAGRVLVLVDSCMWAAFFSSPGSSEKIKIDSLLDHDRVALTDPIVAEILRGFRRREQADWVASRLRMAHYLEPTWDDWHDAAALGRDLAALAHELPLTDLVVAVIALRIDASVYTSDPHFDLMPQVKRYR
jgi:predicted nucleic acid-binding protein